MIIRPTPLRMSFVGGGSVRMGLAVEHFLELVLEAF
jgi:galactokinase/mevalonate kinase-like predicted kinase